MMMTMILTILVGAALPGESTDGTCYDPSGFCSELLCPCEDACYFNWDCPTGSYCRHDREGAGGCFCVSFQGEPIWGVTGDVAGRCEVAGVSPGSWWFNIEVLNIFDGEFYSGATAINNQTQIVGFSGDSAFFWEDGVATEIANPLSSIRVDLNDLGQIVYTNYGSVGTRGTFLMNGPEGQATRINGNHAKTLQINNAGQVLIQTEIEGPGGAMLWQDGVAVPFSVLSDPALRPEALNNLGHIAGVFADGSKWRPGLLTGKGLVELGDTTQYPRSVTDLNDLGQVTYTRHINFEPGVKAYLWEQGTVTDLDEVMPCYPVLWVIAINNCGEMLLRLDDARSVPECEVVFPFNDYGYYSPQTGYRPLTSLLVDRYRWDDVYISDINDRGQIVGEAAILELFGQRGLLISPIPGDFTMDGPINLNDYALFFNRFGHETTDYSIYCNRADFDEDGDTDLQDFATFQNLFTGP